MKNGTIYAERVIKAYAKLRQSVPTPRIPEPDNPLHRLGIAVLGVGCSDAEAGYAIDRALTTLVDWNEMRVSSSIELNKATGNTIPCGVQRCQELIDALQAIYDRENRLSLDQLKSLGRREARHYLEQLSGVHEYAVASVILWSLGGHAIPVNDRLLKALRGADLVHPSADRAEVQAFMERHVSASDAKEFCIVMRSFGDTRQPDSRRTRTKAAANKKNVSNPN
ncbi:MAG: hypothetical protein WBE26_01180 [Phycisphaerae bacterium]